MLWAVRAPVVPKTKPVRAGPTIMAMYMIVRFSESAPGKSSFGTSRGTKAWRAGASKALVAAVSGQQVHQPEGIATHPCGQGKNEGNDRHGRLSSELDALAVVAVGNNASPHGKQDQRYDADKAHRSQRERRMRQDVNVPIDADVLHLGADDGNQRCSTQKSEVPVAQRTIRTLQRFGHAIPRKTEYMD